jgi:hypothetical protein
MAALVMAPSETGILATDLRGVFVVVFVFIWPPAGR